MTQCGRRTVGGSRRRVAHPFDSKETPVLSTNPPTAGFGLAAAFEATSERGRASDTPEQTAVAVAPALAAGAGLGDDVPTGGAVGRLIASR